MSELETKSWEELENIVLSPMTSQEEKKRAAKVLRNRAAGDFLEGQFGRRYRNCSFENALPTQAINVAERFVKTGNGKLLVLKGYPGVGKSYAARCCVRWFYSRYMRTRGFRVPEIYTMIQFKKQFCSPTPFDQQWQVQEAWDNLVNAQMILFEDVGLENRTDSFFEKFNELFDILHDEMRTCIITTNVDFPKGYGKRIESRVADWSFEGKTHICKGEDLRKEKQ